jgi:invasion protein IalB
MTAPRIFIFPLLACLCLALMSPVLAQNSFGDWVLQTSGEGGDRVCYAATVAKQLGSSAENRTESVLYISAWSKDGIKSEISVKLGYPAKAAAGAKITIGAVQFDLFIAGERAYVADATQELKLVDAMKKGSTLTVESTSATGAKVTDTYSLNGIKQALQAQATACP